MAETRGGLIWSLLELALKSISPQIKELVRDFVKRIEEAAQKTSNPIDDILVMLLKIAISFDE